MMEGEGHGHSRVLRRVLYGPAGCHTFIELRLSPFDRFVESHAINAV
jgi:hypothetical protein